MREIILLGLLLIGVIFMSGCTQQETTCNPLYIKVGNSCCLDENNNNICDTDEISFHFTILSAEWVLWKEGNICESLNKYGGSPYKIVIEAKVSCNQYVECKVKIDGIPANDVICSSNIQYVTIEQLVTYESEIYSGVDVTKNHEVEICCKDICKTIWVDKLC